MTGRNVVMRSMTGYSGDGPDEMIDGRSLPEAATKTRPWKRSTSGLSGTRCAAVAPFAPLGG
jgi:hypothetical protein